MQPSAARNILAQDGAQNALRHGASDAYKVAIHEEAPRPTVPAWQPFTGLGDVVGDHDVANVRVRRGREELCPARKTEDDQHVGRAINDLQERSKWDPVDVNGAVQSLPAQVFLVLFGQLNGGVGAKEIKPTGPVGVDFSLKGRVERMSPRRWRLSHVTVGHQDVHI
jgi:hypothetical protein